MDAPEKFPTTANVAKLIQLFAKQYEENPRVVLRELIQNAADAITIARKIDPQHPGRIEIEVIREDDRRKYEVDLAVRDTAMGMDVESLQGYLACLGEGSKAGDIDTIGQWGIGFFAIVVACPWAIIVTKQERSPAIVYRYSVAENDFVQESGALAAWIIDREFGGGGEPARSQGTTIYLKIDFKKLPILKDWLVPQRLIPELRTFCLLVPHPLSVRNGETGEVTVVNLSTLPWNCSGPEREIAFQPFWGAILPYTESENYPKLVHCFSHNEDPNAEFTGVIYFVAGHRGGASIYYKSIYVEHAMDVLPSWASVFTLLLNAKTSPGSPTHHLEVPPSRTHVVRNDAFFTLIRELEDEAIQMMAGATDSFRIRLQGFMGDSERRSEAVRKASEDAPVITALSAIGDLAKSIGLDVVGVMAEAIASTHPEPYYKDAVLALFGTRLPPGLKRDDVIPALQAHAKFAEKNAAEERVLQRANKDAPTWYPESSTRFVRTLGEHILVRVVIKEYPFGRQPRFQDLRVPASCLALLDPALVGANGVVRLPVLTKGDATEYLYSADQDRVVIVAKPEEVLLLMCAAHATKKFKIDLVHSGRTKFQPMGADEDWNGVLKILKQLSQGHLDSGDEADREKIFDVVDVAGYDRTEFPLIVHDVDGQRHLTVNGWNRGMQALNKTLNRALAQGLARAEKALCLIVHELYHSSVLADDSGPALMTLHLFDVRQEELIEVCSLLNEFFDLRAART